MPLYFFLGAPISVSVSGSDRGTGTEGVSEAVIAALTERGTGSDSGSVAVTGGSQAIAGADSEMGSDTAAIQATGSVSIFGSDAALGAEGRIGRFGSPAPVLYAPLTAVCANGLPGFEIALDEVEATLYATLSDTPPSGVSSALDLTGATALFLLRETAGGTLALANAGRIVGSTGVGITAAVAYDFTALDLAGLAPGNGTAAFLITFPDNQTREFRGLAVTVFGPGS